ncbi:MAG: putative Histidine kinase with sensor domain and response regulator receiver domain [Solirubrobacteraceae bacterium]|nr:putative Histidine kinase with sensor domain and response regulator receiver domain [Solirubrobacteraceae bacterium]
MTAKPTAKEAGLHDARRLELFNRSERLGGMASWEWVPETGSLTWSDNMFRLFGHEPGSLTPSTEAVLAQVHPEDVEEVEAGLKTLAHGGELELLDYRILWDGGGLRHLHATFATYGADAAGPARMVGSVQDVTSWHRFDRTLKAHAAVSDAVSQWEEFEPGAERLLAGLAGPLGLAFGVLWVPEGPALAPRVVWHRPSSAFATVAAATEGYRPGRGSPIVGQAWERRQPVVSAHPWSGSPRPRAAAIRAAGIQAAIALPTVAVGKTLAVLELLASDPVEPTDHLLGMLTGISHEIGYFLARHHGDLVGPVLTPRELQVLQLAAREYSAADIALELFLSPATVKRHFGRAYARLGVNDRAAAVAKAMRAGLIT